MKSSSKRFMVGISVVIMLFLCFGFVTRAFQNDTFYTIKIGKLILENGIDMVDHFSWHNLPYTYPHWMYDVIIYKIYDMFDFNGLYIFTILSFVVLSVMIYFVNVKLSKSYFLSLLFGILATIMAAHYATTRAQLFTYILFVMEIFFIERLLSSSKKRYMFFLFVVCVLIANLHAAVWPFYFILMLPYLFEEFVYRIKERFHFSGRNDLFCERLVIEGNKNIRLLLLVFGISLFLGFITPIGNTPYTYFIKIMQGNTTEYIFEHKPLVLTQNLFVVGFLIIMFVPLIFTRVKVRLADICMMCGLVLMSFVAVRHVSFLAVVGMIFLCRMISNIGYIQGSEPLDFELPKIGCFIVLFIIIVTSFLVYSVNSKKEFVDSSLYPVEMVEYMKSELDLEKVRLFNDYDFGSYLIFQDIKVYIDSRSDLYTEPFNRDFDIFDECMNITRNYGRVFKKYDITHILVYKDTDLNQILSASDNYDVVHKAGRFVLYEYLANTASNGDKK